MHAGGSHDGIEPRQYVVFGGGCYGTFYVGQLLKATAASAIALDRILVIDRDPECQVARAFPDEPRVDLHTAPWLSFGEHILHQASLSTAHWVPAPLAPHVIYHWLRTALHGEVIHAMAQPPAATHEQRVVLPDIPFAQLIRDGTVALSHAPALCPVHCIEPRKCPLTKEERHWEMQATVQAMANRSDISHLETFICRHHAYGVGTIPIASIRSAYRRLRDQRDQLAGAIVAIGTLSACHGVVDLFRIP